MVRQVLLMFEILVGRHQNLEFFLFSGEQQFAVRKRTPTFFIGRYRRKVTGVPWSKRTRMALSARQSADFVGRALVQLPLERVKPRGTKR